MDLSGREGSVILKLLDTHYSIMDRYIYPSSYHENALKAKKSRKDLRLNEPNLMRSLSEYHKSSLHLGSINSGFVLRYVTHTHTQSCNGVLIMIIFQAFSR